MGSYRHLSREDREEIAVLRAAGHANAGIAAALGRAPSTISREVRRNALDSGRYSARTADGAYLLRRQRSALLERDNLQAVGEKRIRDAPVVEPSDGLWHNPDLRTMAG